MKIIVNIEGYAGIYNPSDPNKDFLASAIASGFEYRLIEDRDLPEEKPMERKWLWSSDGPIKVSPFTEEEIRAHRNTLLAASDWTQIADAPVDQAAWATYRQALRDVTEQVGFPETINWPVAP